MKKHPPIWIAADFECMNVPSESTSENGFHIANKLFANEAVAIGYNILKNPDYDKLKLEKGDYDKVLAENCVVWFIKDMLEIKTDKKNYF